MANPHQLPPGNTAFGSLSAASSSLPTRSSTPAVDYPHAFMAEQMALTRTALRLNPCVLPNFYWDTLSRRNLSETTTLTLLSQSVRGLVAISDELPRVTQKRISLARENHAQKEELRDHSSHIVNLPLPQTPPTHQDLSVLQPAIRDLSHRVTAGAPPLTQAPIFTPQPQPPARPLPTRKGTEKAQAPPSHPPKLNEDPKYLIPYDYTKLGRAFRDPESYAQLFPHSYEAGEFPRGAYDLVSFTPGHLHPDYSSSPAYPQAASGSGWGGKTVEAPKPPSLQQVASAAAPLLRRVRHPPWDVAFFAIPQPLTQTLPQSQQSSPTSPLAFSPNPTAYSPLVSLHRLTSAGPSHLL